MGSKQTKSKRHVLRSTDLRLGKKYTLVLTLAVEHSLSMSRSKQRPLPTDPKIQYTQNTCGQAGSIFLQQIFSQIKPLIHCSTNLIHHFNLRHSLTEVKKFLFYSFFSLKVIKIIKVLKIDQLGAKIWLFFLMRKTVFRLQRFCP